MLKGRPNESEGLRGHVISQVLPASRKKAGHGVFEYNECFMCEGTVKV